MVPDRCASNSAPRTNMFSSSTTLILLSLLGSFGNGEETVAFLEWNYQNEDEWFIMFSTCNGSQQSPISIDSSATVSRNYPDLVYGEGYYNCLENVTIINNGHTVQVTPISSDMTVSGGPLQGEYRLVQFHFHWGAKDGKGSEHALDGRKFSMEMHMVHIHVDYTSLADALQYENGVMVTGVWLDVDPDCTDEENSDSGQIRNHNQAIQEVVAELQNIPEKNDQEHFRMKGTMMEFLPKTNAARNSYFTYSGSLTTPSCHENVLWMVLTAVQPISHIQLQAFRDLDEDEAGSNENEDLEDNYRDPQPLNNRTVYKSDSNYPLPPTNCGQS